MHRTATLTGSQCPPRRARILRSVRTAPTKLQLGRLTVCFRTRVYLDAVAAGDVIGAQDALARLRDADKRLNELEIAELQTPAFRRDLVGSPA